MTGPRARTPGTTTRVGWLQRLIACVGLALASPLMAVAGLVIRLSSPGPMIYAADRIGQDSCIFTMYKLRTMHIDTAVQGQITGGKDPRIFLAGRFIRKMKLDEVPQLINVMRGEMAFVGPRPEAPEIVAESYSPWMMETLRVPPGIVGPGSLGYFLAENGLPDDPRAAQELYVQHLLPRKLARELVFVRRPTVRYQLQLLARTMLGIVRLEGFMSRWQQAEEWEARLILAEVSRSDPYRQSD